MIDLLFWFLVSQTLVTLPDMTPGTEVRVVSNDLLTIYATGLVDNSTLMFDGELEPGKEVRLLILTPNADSKQTVDALGHALFGMVAQDGSDILLKFEDLEGPLSFGKWLQEERGIGLDLTNTVPKAGE